VDRQQAEILYDSGKQPTVAKLLEYDAQNNQLKKKIAQLEYWSDGLSLMNSMHQRFSMSSV
jgi:hypothetical protein